MAGKLHDENLMQRTPFHSRVMSACGLNLWEEWKGYTTPQAYTNVELEYFAIRNSASVFDLTPMTKYRITGTDAHAYLDRLVTRDLAKLSVGRVMYVAWCNDEGKVMDDGTIFRLGEQSFRLCSQERHLDWLHWSALGFDVEIEDETDDVAALALQGPSSCAILKAMGLAGVEALTPFDARFFSFAGGEMLVSRTGFTGDLGYELWVKPDLAETLWDQLMEAGDGRHILPVGSQALQIARIEAGFIQAARDFVPAEQEIRHGRARSPYELGLGWLVHLKKERFTGRSALIREKEQGSRYRLVKLDVAGNIPADNSFILNGRGRQVGIVTSAAWVPTAKRNVAFASIDANASLPDLWAEIYYLRELHWTRVKERCQVIEGPIYSPDRRTVTPALDF